MTVLMFRPRNECSERVREITSSVAGYGLGRSESEGWRTRSGGEIPLLLSFLYLFSEAVSQLDLQELDFQRRDLQVQG